MRILGAIDGTVIIVLGPFISEDGKTPMGSFTAAQIIQYTRGIFNGSDRPLVFLNMYPAPTVTYLQDGFYSVTFQWIQWASFQKGHLVLHLKLTGALLVWNEFQIVNPKFADFMENGVIDYSPVTSILNDTNFGMKNIHDHAQNADSMSSNCYNVVADTTWGLPANKVRVEDIQNGISVIKAYIDTLETELAKVVGKLPATGLISAQNDVVAIQNNTSFVTTLPDTAMIPTVIFPFKVNCFTYDTAGNMEDTDSGLYMKLETSYGVSRNDRMFSDTAMGTNLTLVTTGQFAGYVRFIPVDQGSWTGYYKASPTDDAELLVGTFKYIEGGVMKTYGRSIMLTKQNVGDVNIAATDANMGVIAKAIRGYDSSLMGLNPLSIEGRNWKDHVDIATAVSDVHQQTIFLSTQHDAIILQNGVTITDLNHIMPEIDHISTTVDTINSEATQILTELGNSLKLTTIIDGATLGKLLTALQAIAVGGADITDVAGGKRRITYKKNDGVTDAFTVETSGSGITRISW